jgi:hypothetical protein
LVALASGDDWTQQMKKQEKSRSDGMNIEAAQ